MKSTLLALVTLALGAATASPLAERAATSHSWAGTSNYFLQGMSDADQDAYLRQLSQAGVKVIRVWVNAQAGGRACAKGSISATYAPEFETTLGQYNWQTVDLLDKTLVAIGKYGMKALISPHDGNLLHGPNGNDAYGSKFGSGYFYEHQDAFDTFDNRLRAIVNYKGKYSNKVWKDWHEVIMAFDLQNEPFASKTEECNYSTAQSWACGRANTLRSALGASNPIKIATGGLGGDISHGCTFLASAMSCDQIDMVSVHRYAGPESSNPKQWTNSYGGWMGQTKGKLVYVEEWGINTTRYNIQDEFRANTQDMNAGGLPWLYWQILPEKKCDYKDGDPFGFHVNTVDVASAVKGASSANSKQDWSGIVW
ncbi:hypothetical protein PWT90_07250 [Aphanocladium album]|nr:hypothetical protein PWT90_07250 [Aphanocladium album]